MSTRHRLAGGSRGYRRGGRGGLWRAARLAAAALLAATSIVLPQATADAGSYVAINGSGSSWSYPAINQWSEDVRPQGLVVNYNPDGSAQGRLDYMQGGSVQFAGSDPPFNSGEDKLGGTQAQVPEWGYSYVPDTAGGTAFMYHLVVGGHMITNLRLSGQVLFDIFTGAITNWDNKLITQSYGAQLPNIPIIPVVRSDGSGATYFLTRWMSTVFASQWNSFCEKVHPGITLPCGVTEFYPSNFGDVKAENGSNNVADYITSSYGQGAIGYDEYAYALNAHYPVVQMLNLAGYYVGPTASNVAVALNSAIINEDPSSPNYMQQDVTPLYTDKDPRAYTLSSYSYLIVPKEGTRIPPAFNDADGVSLSTFINYLLCTGQKQMGPLGYSPLPYPLVSRAFGQVGDIPGHVREPNIAGYASCGNPTWQGGRNVLLDTAPYPSPCQKLGSPLNNCTDKDGHAVAGGGSGGSGSGSSGSGSSGTSGNGGSASADPATGGTSGGTDPSAGVANVTGTVVSLAGNGTDRALLGVLTALAIIAAVAMPPVVGIWLRRRRRHV